LIGKLIKLSLQTLNKRQLNFAAGQAFNDLFDVVLGAEVAKTLGYSLDDKITLAHGLGNTSFSLHDDRPFKVTGILASTGTPVDQTVHISLQGIEAIHIDWKQGVKIPGSTIQTEQLAALTLTPKTITAFMLGLNSRMTIFQVQRDINNYRQEPLSAILPGVALSELWQMIGILENTLRLISGLILIAALLGLSAMMLASIREREHEIHLLRVIGAPPSYLFLLVEMEALLISFLSLVIALSGLYLGLLLSGDFLTSKVGLQMSFALFSGNNLLFILLAIGATIVAAALPSFFAYRNAKLSR